MGMRDSSMLCDIIARSERKDLSLVRTSGWRKLSILQPLIARNHDRNSNETVWLQSQGLVRFRW